MDYSNLAKKVPAGHRFVGFRPKFKLAEAREEDQKAKSIDKGFDQIITKMFEQILLPECFPVLRRRHRKH